MAAGAATGGPIGAGGEAAGGGGSDGPDGAPVVGRGTVTTGAARRGAPRVRGLRRSQLLLRRAVENVEGSTVTRSGQL
ncbi:hypothetical protein GCM10009760_46410 [Kitasatospora kazusensis]|uniref:Uncharacterized protein n=1 Tax=Kitasatospora kazusensis TaxID=407974 RepID=A0ABN3A124_9ACTN